MPVEGGVVRPALGLLVLGGNVDLVVPRAVARERQPAIRSDVDLELIERVDGELLDVARLDEDEVPGPAQAMGDALTARLQAAGIVFRVIEK